MSTFEIRTPILRLAAGLATLVMREAGTPDAKHLLAFSTTLQSAANEHLRARMVSARGGLLRNRPARDRAQQRWEQLGLHLQQRTAEYAREIDAASDLEELVGALPSERMLEPPQRPEPMF